MSENLYTLSAELAVINDEIVDAEGVVTPELEARLDGLGLAFDKKVYGIVRWTLNLKGNTAALDIEIKRLQARKKAAENLDKRLKEFIALCLRQADRKKVEFDTFTVALQKNPASADIENEAMIPAKFLTIVPEQKVVDKKAVLDALKKGEVVEGATLINDRTHLRIR